MALRSVAESEDGSGSAPPSQKSCSSAVTTTSSQFDALFAQAMAHPGESYRDSDDEEEYSGEDEEVPDEQLLPQSARMFDDGGSLRLEDAPPPAEEKTGYLIKRSGAISRHLRRFFLLREGTLLWFESASKLGLAPLGAARTHLCRIVHLPEGGGIGFAIHAPTKVYQLRAPSPAEAAAWVAALREHAALPPAASELQAGSLRTSLATLLFTRLLSTPLLTPPAHASALTLASHLLSTPLLRCVARLRTGAWRCGSPSAP